MPRPRIVATLYERAASCAVLALIVLPSVARADDPSPGADPKGASHASPPASSNGAPDANAPPSTSASTVAPTAASPPPDSAPPDSNGVSPTRGIHLIGNRPTPLHVDYAQYGLAFGGDFDLASGGICPTKAVTPCIIGSGGGLTLRGGYRPAGPWYFGAAYQFSKLDSDNLIRLAIFQQLRFETRYFLDFGSRITPFLEWGGGGCVYGNLWGVSTGGAIVRGGVGFQFEITRFVVVGMALAYSPALLAGYTDATNQKRDTGITHFLHFEVLLELKSELGRE